MWMRLGSRDLRIVSHYVGMLVIGIGLAMMIPIVAGLAYAEWGPVLDFVLGMGVALAVGTLLLNAETRPERVTHTHALAITAFGWVAAAMAAGVPLALASNYGSYLDGVFDAVSGLTVSGLTVVSDLDHLSVSHNMWRHLMQLIGGQGIVVAALSLAVGLRGGAFSLYLAEGRDERILPNVLHTARFIWFVTAVYVASGTMALFGILTHLGVSLDRSILHAFWLTAAAFDTGGFAPQRMNLMYYHSTLVEMTALFLMMAGSINFALHAHVWRGARNELWKNLETRVLASVVTFGSMLVAVGLLSSERFPGGLALLRKGIFQVISGHSAGHQTVYGNQLLEEFGSIGLLAIIIGMAIGGSLSSTGGGVKALRIGVITKSIILQTKRALAPPSSAVKVRYHHITERILTPDVTGAAATVFILYLGTYLMGGVAGAIYGYGIPESLFESVSATANSGLSVGITSPSMPTGLKLVYMFQMWAGRLEFIAVLVLIAQIVLAFDLKGIRKR
jgi:trk system potassium uptake protein